MTEFTDPFVAIVPKGFSHQGALALGQALTAVGIPAALVTSFADPHEALRDARARGVPVVAIADETSIELHTGNDHAMGALIGDAIAAILEAFALVVKAALGHDGKPTALPRGPRIDAPIVDGNQL